MAIAREGSVDTSPVGWSAPFSFSVTIPAETDIIVIFDLGWEYNISGATLGAQSFTIDHESTQGGSNDDVALLHLFSPSSTGAQNISVSYSTSHGDDSRVYAIYYSGVDTAGLRDSDVADGYSLTLTTQSGDVCVVGAAADSSISWTNATELASGGATGVGDTSVAHLTADGTSETISCTNSNSGIVGLVLIPATGGASAKPSILARGVGVGMFKGMTPGSGQYP